MKKAQEVDWNHIHEAWGKMVQKYPTVAKRIKAAMRRYFIDSHLKFAMQTLVDAIEECEEIDRKQIKNPERG